MDRVFQSQGQQRYHFIDLILVDDERWREHNQVTAAIAELTRIGPCDEADAECGGSERFGEGGGTREWGSAALVFYELDAGQQALPSNITDIWQRAQRLQLCLQYRSHRGGTLDKAILFQVLDRSHAGSAQGRMMRKCLGVQQAA
jgi:hypothetical protein